MVVTLVRCGECEENFLGKIIGMENKLMNDTGRRQCQKLRMSLKNEEYDYCYMSPQVRAVETAMILIGDRVEMIPDKRLIERDMGDLTGRLVDEYNAFKFWDYELNREDYGVEPIQNLFSRCLDFFDYITNKHSESRLMVVVDLEVYRTLRHIFLKSDLKGNLLDKKIKNCSMEKFEIKL